MLKSVVHTDNNPLAYVHKSKFKTCQIWLLSYVSLSGFAIKSRIGKSNKAADALSHSPLNQDLSLDSDNDSDKVNVISYPLVSNDINDDTIKTTSYSSMHEIVNWHLGTTKFQIIRKWRHKPSVSQ